MSRLGLEKYVSIKRTAERAVAVDRIPLDPRDQNALTIFSTISHYFSTVLRRLWPPRGALASMMRSFTRQAATPVDPFS